MELKEFVKATLLETMEAIHEAQKEWHTRTGGRGVINPAWGGTEELHKHVQQLEFDVAVTVEKKTSGRAGGGVKVVALDLGVGGEIAASNSTVSHIKFKVPIVPPVQVVMGGGRPS